MKLWCFINTVACLLTVINSQKELRTWTYSLIEIQSTTSNEELLKPDIQVRQLGRGEYAVDGSIWYNADFGEKTIVEFKAYRSASASYDFLLLPYQIAKQTFFEYLNTMYRSTIMRSLANCSDMPYSSEKFVPPLEKKMYTLKNCIINAEGFPKYLPAGFYKMVFNGYDPQVNWTGHVITEVENEIL